MSTPDSNRLTPTDAIPPDVAKQAPGEKEAEQVVAGAQNVHLF
jgi:hypothetical protein